MKFAWSSLLCVSVVASIHADSSPSVPDLVKQLGDSKFAVREAAHKELLKRGEGIAPELALHAKLADLETGERLRKILFDLVGYKDSIRRILTDIKANDQPIPVELIGLVSTHQPGAGDHLLSILDSPKDPIQIRAVRAFVACWDLVTPDQLESYIRKCATVKTSHRAKYPAKINAMVQFETQFRDGWAGWPSMEKKLDFRTRTTRYLDGKQYEQPFVYPYPFATVGWIRTGELTEGKHTVHAVMEYEFAQKGQKRKGEIRSKDSHFEIVGADTPDDLVASRTAALSKTLGTSFTFLDCEARPAEVVLETTGLTPFEFNTSPQISWTDQRGGLYGLSCVNWKLTADLPVDLCYGVEIHEVKSGKIHAADSLIAVKHQTASGYIYPRDAHAFAKDREGFVAVKIVMKPSRALALTDLRITRYYPEPITSAEVRMRIVTPMTKKTPAK